MKVPICFLLGFLSTIAVAQKNPNFADGKTTMVQLFEWKYDDVATECENFLQQKGYAGVQISPPTENIILIAPNRTWLERYQPVSYNFITRSGDEKSLANMIKRCNAVGVRIYVDIVFNQMAAVKGTGIGGTTCDPANKDYPGVPYTAKDFHETCDIGNSTDPTVIRNCELVGLKDLDQSSEYVRGKIVDLLNRLVDLGAAGFRVDLARYMWPDDLKVIYNTVKNLSTEHGFAPKTRPYIFQEIVDLGGDPISATEYTFASVMEFKSGLCLGQTFQRGNNLEQLENWGTEWGLLNSSDSVVFIDNHDNQRNGGPSILTYQKPKLYKMATAFELAHPFGTARVMSSYDFKNDLNIGPPQDKNEHILTPKFDLQGNCINGWVCEHRWREIANMAGFRNTVIGTNITNWWSGSNKNQIAFGRGDKGFIAFTLVGDINQQLQTSLPAGRYCDVISGSKILEFCTGKIVTVNSKGLAHISLLEKEDNGVLAIHIKAKLWI